MEALEALANAFRTLIKTAGMKLLKVGILKHTVLASLMGALSPVAWLQIGKIIGESDIRIINCILLMIYCHLLDNPWMNAKQLALKAGAVLGELLSNRVFGSRPVTLCGYSLGSLVIFEALKYLTTLPPSETANLIQDIFLFGTPAPIDESTWSAVRRVVCGRLVNGYAKEDYVLAVLSRASSASWGVAGLEAVQVKGVENVRCDVDGHIMWRGLIGSCLRKCGAPGIISEEVDAQLLEVAKPDKELAADVKPEILEQDGLGEVE